MKSVPILHTFRCVLSAVTPADIPMLRQILTDSDTQRFLPELCGGFQTEGSLRQFLATFDTYLQHDEGLLWGIRKENTFIGFMAIMDIPNNPTLFYAMHPAYRNQGLMKESLMAVIDYTKGKNLSKKIQTEVFSENKPSLTLLMDVGFILQGTIEQKLLLIKD